MIKGIRGPLIVLAQPTHYKKKEGFLSRMGTWWKRIDLMSEDRMNSWLSPFEEDRGVISNGKLLTIVGKYYPYSPTMVRFTGACPS
jgi:hypothetical protein